MFNLFLNHMLRPPKLPFPVLISNLNQITTVYQFLTLIILDIPLLSMYMGLCTIHPH